MTDEFHNYCVASSYDELKQFRISAATAMTSIPKFNSAADFISKL